MGGKVLRQLQIKENLHDELQTENSYGSNDADVTHIGELIYL